MKKHFDARRPHVAPAIRPDSAELLDHAAIANRADLPEWFAPTYAAFRRTVLDPTYPCMFGTIGEKKGELRYSFADGPTAAHLPATLTAFAKLAAANPETRHALAVFVEPKTVVAPHEEYEADFWSMLTHLSMNDPAPWPAGQPTDPSDPAWEWCFNGLPMFVFGASPSYQLRRSRNLGPSLVLLFQPRTVFAGIEGGTPGGVKVRETIRARLAAWDLVDAHPAFGDYGDPSSNEWKQYFVPDTDTPVVGPCPFVYRPVEPVRVIPGSARSLAHTVFNALPVQGSVEVQRDAAGKEHAWHVHAVDEELSVVKGELTFAAQGRVWTCGAGSRVVLPAGVVHASVAGAKGAVYVIRTGAARAA